VRTSLSHWESRLVDRVVRLVRDEVGVDPTLDTRVPSVAHARQVVMALLVLAGLSTPKVGQALGRDHSTVIYGARRALERDRDVVDRLWWRVNLERRRLGLGQGH